MIWSYALTSSHSRDSPSNDHDFPQSRSPRTTHCLFLKLPIPFFAFPPLPFSSLLPLFVTFLLPIISFLRDLSIFSYSLVPCSPALYLSFLFPQLTFVSQPSTHRAGPPHLPTSSCELNAVYPQLSMLSCTPLTNYLYVWPKLPSHLPDLQACHFWELWVYASAEYFPLPGWPPFHEFLAVGLACS